MISHIFLHKTKIVIGEITRLGHYIQYSIYVTHSRSSNGLLCRFLLLVDGLLCPTMTSIIKLALHRYTPEIVREKLFDLHDPFADDVGNDWCVEPTYEVQ